MIFRICLEIILTTVVQKTSTPYIEEQAKELSIMWQHVHTQNKMVSAVHRTSHPETLGARTSEATRKLLRGSST